MSAIAQRIAANSLNNAVGRVWVIVITLILTAYAVHRLGTEAFAIWSVTLAVSSYAAIFDLGAGSAFAKFVAAYRPRRDLAGISTVVSSGLAFYLTGGVVVGIVAVSVEPHLARAFNLPPELASAFRDVLRITVCGFVAQNTANAFRAVIFGFQRVDVMRNIWVWTGVVQLAGGIIALELGGGLKGLAISNLIYLLTMAGATFAASLRLCPGLRIGPRALRWAPLKRFIGFGAQVQLVSLSNLVHLQVDKLLLPIAGGLAGVALYDLGQKAARGIQILPMLMIEVAVPAASELDARGDRSRLLTLYRRGSRCLALFTLPLVALAAAAAPALVRLWLGPGFEVAALCLSVMVLSYGLHVMTGMGTAVTRGMGRPQIEVQASLLMAAAHVILSAYLIARAGLVGALTGLAVSGVTANLYFLLRLHALLGYSNRRFLGEVLAWPLGMAAIGGAATTVAGVMVRGVMPEGRAGALGVLLVQGLVFVGAILPFLGSRRAVSDDERELVRVALRRFGWRGGTGMGEGVESAPSDERAAA
jgi:O-antigen/teichoic acid export membrane protein